MKIVADKNIPFVQQCFSSLGDVEIAAGWQITPKVVAAADILLVRSVTKVNAELLENSGVRFVGTATIGVDHIDTDFLQSRKIGFASAPGSNANSVAEYVTAGLLEIAAKKNIGLAGKSIGIIGVGNVGSRVAEKCRALGMKPYLNDPPLQRQTADARYLPVEELYSCDFITLHTSLTLQGRDKTFHLAGEGFLRALKKGCVFLNTSRGAVVDSTALKGEIASGRFAAVLLDVWENEPAVDTELLRMVDIATPHIAGYSLDGKVSGLIMIYQAACEYFGLQVKFKAADFLLKPEIDKLQIAAGGGQNEQEMLRRIVKKVYDINYDDIQLRQIADLPAKQQGGFFSKLRKNYPVRREFANTKIFVEPGSDGLTRRLKGIGFPVANADG